jgi:hypothetical protein
MKPDAKLNLYQKEKALTNQANFFKISFLLQALQLFCFGC